MTPDPTLRAVAERLAQDVYEQYRKENGGTYFPLSSQGEDDRERAILCVLAGLSHRDRTAEREAARKALDALRNHLHPNWVSNTDPMADWSSRYLAAEFDAGERVTLSDGSVVRFAPADGSMTPWKRTYDGCVDLRPRKVASSEWTGILNPTDTGADFDAVKRLAEQRGAER